MARTLSVIERFICLIGQGFGTGRSPWAPGTVGTLPGLVLAWFLWNAGPALYLVIMTLVVIIAIWVSGRTADLLGVHDDPRIVIDEIAGILVTLALVPPSVPALLTGFVLFRLLDISKPPPISTIDQRLRGGFGIVADDVVAGLGANLCLQLLFRWGSAFG